MLVLGRKVGEETCQNTVVLTIPPSDEPTSVRVILCGGDDHLIRVGFECERKVRIVREELLAPEEASQIRRDILTKRQKQA